MLPFPKLLISATLSIAALASSDQSIIPGQYADADIVALADHTYLLYYAVEPEVVDTNFEIYVATSTNGTDWTRYDDAVLTQATFPDAIQLADGSIRLYFQRAGSIYSAVSENGITNFTIEDGVRIEPQNNLDTDGVAAPTVVEQPDGSYYMVFRAAVRRPYTPTSVNTTTTVLIGATSDDGLAWERQGVVVNGRHAIYDGYVDGPELFYGDDNKLHLRYWAPGGTNTGAIDGHFQKKSKNNGQTWNRRNLVISDILGGDPTYVYIDNILHMYYSVHTSGIYLRTFE